MDIAEQSQEKGNFAASVALTESKQEATGAVIAWEEEENGPSVASNSKISNIFNRDMGL